LRSAEKGKKHETLLDLNNFFTGLQFFTAHSFFSYFFATSRYH